MHENSIYRTVRLGKRTYILRIEYREAYNDRAYVYTQYGKLVAASELHGNDNKADTSDYRPYTRLVRDLLTQ